MSLDAGAFAGFRLRGTFVDYAAWFAVGMAATATRSSPAFRFRTTDLMLGVGGFGAPPDLKGVLDIATPLLDGCASVVRRAAPAIDDPALAYYRTDDGIVVIARAVKIPRHQPPVYSLVPMPRPDALGRFREHEIVHSVVNAANEVVRSVHARAELQAQGF